MAVIVGGSPLPKSASAEAPGSRATRARAVRHLCRGHARPHPGDGAKDLQ
jgi:hypothetical protein